MSARVRNQCGIDDRVVVWDAWSMVPVPSLAPRYARYFGGDLDIKSMEGYGTDAFVHLSRLGDHDEPLP